ncbi:hypothetical protein ACP4OV_029071 [Aristida adscensionis]
MTAAATIQRALLARPAPAPAAATAAGALRAGGTGPRKWRARARAAAEGAVGDPRPAIDEYPEGILSGEWPGNFSLLTYANLRAYLESQILTSHKPAPTAKLGDVMSRPVQVATPGQRLAEIDAFFAAQSGLPVVVDGEGSCVGVVSKKDKAKAANGLESTVGEVMSSPAITLTPEKTVLEAAAIMLKEKVHRIPVVNEQQQVIVSMALETRLSTNGDIYSYGILVLETVSGKRPPDSAFRQGSSLSSRS